MSAEFKATEELQALLRAERDSLARLLNTIAIDAELATHKTTLSYELDGAKA